MQVTDARPLRELLVSPHPGFVDRLIEIVANTGILLEGHFELDPLHHAPYLIRFSEIGWNQPLVEEVAGMLLETAPYAREPATIVCAETSAIFLAQALGRKTGNPVAVVDTAHHPMPRLRTGTISNTQPILVVSDVVTDGQSLLPLLELSPSQVAGIVAFAVQSPSAFTQFAQTHDIKAEWLLSTTWMTNRPHPVDCRGCAATTPILHAIEFS